MCPIYFCRQPGVVHIYYEYPGCLLVRLPRRANWLVACKHWGLWGGRAGPPFFVFPVPLHRAREYHSLPCCSTLRLLLYAVCLHFTFLICKRKLTGLACVNPHHRCHFLRSCSFPTRCVNCSPRATPLEDHCKVL